MRKQTTQRKENLAETVQSIEGLLGDYSRYVSQEQASFLRTYLKSLELDLEVALTRGNSDDLEIILEDIEALRHNALAKLKANRDD